MAGSGVGYSGSVAAATRYVEQVHGAGCDHNDWVLRPIREWRDGDRSRFKHHKYKQWFACGKNGSIPRIGWHDGTFSEQLHNCSMIRSVAAFRLGYSWLGVETLRSEIPQRSLRVCRLCSKNEIEDEVHFLNCEAYNNIRERFPLVFTGASYTSLRTCWEHGSCDVRMDTAMKNLMSTSVDGFWNSLGAYLIMARKVRSERIRVLGET